MIEIKHLSKSFGNLQVLKDVNLTIEDGQTVALIGSSGSGKSTLLRCVNLLETPDSGSITIGDVTVDAGNIDKATIKAVRSKSAMVFQTFNLFNNKTAQQNVSEALKVVRRLPNDKASEIAEQQLRGVGMWDWADHYPIALSGGQQQRVAIARALALDPEVILFDEPTSALDPELVGGVLEVINQLTTLQKTMLIVTHEMTFARDVASKIVFLDDGRIIESGEPHAFFDHPKTERAGQFLARFRYEFVKRGTES